MEPNWALGEIKNINNLFLAYSFTILNSLQGVGIFVFQCLLNPAIRSVARRRVSPVLGALGLGSRRGEYATTEMEVTSGEKQPQSSIVSESK